LGVHQGVRPPLGRDSVWRFEMEYIVSGITAVVLFVYLLYALLRPEKF
jgi:K+-transporting ATPase KdpF subunit